MFKKVKFLVYVLALVFLMGAIGAKRFNITAGGIGSGTNTFATAWSKIINSKAAGYSSTVIATGGALEACQMVAQRLDPVGFGDIAIIFNALAGDRRVHSEEELKILRSIATYQYGAFQAVVREDSGIKSISDLKGKKVSLGAPGASATDSNRKLMEACGLAPGSYKEQLLTMEAATDGLRDNNLDCMLILTPGKAPQVMDLSTRTQVRLLPIPEKAFANIFDEKKIPASKGWSKGYWSTDAYLNLANKERIPTVSMRSGIFSRQDVDEVLVYTITKTLWDNLKEFQSSTGEAGKGWELERALTNIPLPLHPGALKYYQEQKLNIPANLIPPESKK